MTAKVTPLRKPVALLLTDTGKVRPCEHNARLLIAESDEYKGLHFDLFLHRQRIDERDWTDHDDRAALCWLQSTQQVAGFTLSQVRNAMQVVAHERKIDSLREFVERLPKWDGTPRIETAFADALGAADTALNRAASRNFFVALIARALDPGCQVDTLWAFEGPQGSKKSRALRALGEQFHSEISASIGTTDFMRELRGLWIAEMSELDSLRGREASTVKRLLSAPSDRFVEKYQTHAERYQRRAVTVATTNEATYWQDSTGARRLVPIACGDIRLDLVIENRIQWFAEARHRYDGGAHWWEFPGEIKEAQEDRQQVDPWEDTLRSLVARGRRTGIDGQGVEPWPRGWISSATVLKDWLRLEAQQQGQNVGPRLGKVMRRLGYMPRKKGGERGWVDTSDAVDDEVSS